MPGFTEIENRIIKKHIKDTRLINSLALIREVMESIWAGEAPRIVKDYTDHGEKHSERVAGFVEKLLNASPNAVFTDQEIYLLMAGVYLHDIGMQCDVVKYSEIKKKSEKLGAKFNEEFTAKTTSGYSLEEQKEIRKNHHFLSAAWIEYLYDDVVLSNGIRSVPYDLVDDLMDVCKFHSKLPINDCSEFLDGDPNSRKKMVASLLRFADELDISSARVKIETVKIFSLTLENSVYWWLHNYTKINFVDSNKVHLKVNLHPEDFDKYGSFIRKDYITRFKLKNQPVLNVLVEQNIPVVIDNNSDVVAHKRAEKLPFEITVVLDGNMKKSGFSSGYKIPAGSRDSGSGTIHFASVDAKELKLNVAKSAVIHAANIPEPNPEPSYFGRKIVVATTKSFAIKAIVNGEMKCCNLIIKNHPIPDGAITVSQKFETIVANQKTAEIILYESDFMSEYFDVNDDYEFGAAIFELPGNLPAGAPIKVIFSLNNEGIFTVTGKDLTRNKEVHVTIRSKCIRKAL